MPTDTPATTDDTLARKREAAMPIDLTGFEEITPRRAAYGPRRTHRPRIAIRRSGNLSLNSAAWHAMGGPTHIRLLYNRSTGAIAIRSDDGGAYPSIPMRKQPKSDSRLAPIRTFLTAILSPYKGGITVWIDPPIADGVALLCVQDSASSEPTP